ncbi:RRI1 [Candida margitis]|uniref:RRI1 n=1 Tax=Candida margitis TaxID=1775924 RepID=UPI002226D83E|nr:RRI1 [Candida margitis]KAI5970557.1 RRI1 [Candida margitis]
MGSYSELADALEYDSLKNPKLTDIELSKDITRRITTLQTITPGGNNTHDKLVCTRLFDLPAIDPGMSSSKPWKTDAKYFNKCMISSLALMKMTTHAQSGGSIEIMGMLIGKIVDRTIVVMDTYRLPVEGTETRVNAQGEAYEYMVQYLELNQKITKGNKPRQENIVGWYHSHPGYGCWLSGIDVSTQELNQNFQDPYLAIVVDPVRTLKSGKVDIGAFRTTPAAFADAGDSGNTDGTSRAALSNLPKSKRQEFGSHAGRYYSLDIEIFENEYDSGMLKMLQKQDSLDYGEWKRKLAVDDKESVTAVQEDNHPVSLQYLDNFDFVDEDDTEIGALKEITKKLDSLKPAPGESPASSLLKRIIGSNRLNDGFAAQSRSMSRRREVEYEEEDVLDESDLERGYTGEGKLEGETEGEDWDDDEDDESGTEEQTAGLQNVQRDDHAGNEAEEQKNEERTYITDNTAPGNLIGSTSDNAQQPEPATNASSPPRKRSMRKLLRSRKDDLSDLLYNPSLAGVHQKSKRKQKSVARQSAPPLYPDEYLRQTEFFDLQKRQQRWAHERLVSGGAISGSVRGNAYEQTRYPMASSIALDLREKNKSVIEASRVVAAKNVCDLISMEAMKEVEE